MDWTAETGKLGQDSWDRTTGKRHWDRTARKGKSG